MGVVDEECGERVKACIVKKDPALTEEEIIAHCREHLTAYKIPKIIEFFDELPKTNVGKIFASRLETTQPSSSPEDRQNNTTGNRPCIDRGGPCQSVSLKTSSSALQASFSPMGIANYIRTACEKPKPEIK